MPPLHLRWNVRATSSPAKAKEGSTSLGLRSGERRPETMSPIWMALVLEAKPQACRWFEPGGARLRFWWGCSGFGTSDAVT